MPQEGARFDFIVVGGGTAGNTVAGRLAEHPGVSVLVLEAGVGDPQKIQEITTPSTAMDLRNTEHDWAYKATMVKRDDYERVENVNTRGKILGGSSSLNYFTWVPGCKPTFDRWAEFGGKDWAWEPLVPYLRKSATYHDDLSLYSPDLKKIGAGGPIPIAHASLTEELQGFRDALRQAWKSAGGRTSVNAYEGEMNGLIIAVNTIYDGKRSASYMFLKDKPNITVVSGVRSKRLIIDYADRICRGVTVIDSSGAELNFYATREVILAQGVFESPKLLMLSGVGPARELNKHGIDVVVDSRHVGQHLLDHPGVPFVVRVKDGFGLDGTLLRQGPKKDAAVAAYQKDRSGAVASGLLELVGFSRIDEYLEKDPTYRDAKAANGGIDPFSPLGQPHFELDFVCMFASAFQWHYPIPKEGDHLTVMVDLVRPVSEGGEVRLNSADPLVQPDINLNHLADELDIIALREGVRFSYDILTKDDHFKDIVVDEYPWEMPLHSDEAMRQAILERSQTSFHSCGTNRLSMTIGQGVVDPRLKVHGVFNLRVIDASVIPVIPDCRIQNCVYMIGEKGADLIKGDHEDLFK
jgi:choline dehydrogenase-like flavoprotein